VRVPAERPQCAFAARALWVPRLRHRQFAAHRKKRLTQRTFIENVESSGMATVPVSYVLMWFFSSA
jgi:hypothetical protein